MAFKKNSQSMGWLATVTVAMLLIAFACTASEGNTRQSTSVIETTRQPTIFSLTLKGNTRQNTPEIETTATPTGIWSVLLQRTPYAYTTPLPPANPTVLDGTYTKLDPRQGARAPCRRCPPYPPEGGTWKLSLDRGVFRVFHEATGWHSLGSFTVSGERVELFNDPHCYQVVGIYSWKLEGGELTLQLVEDACGVDLRARFFTSLPWTSCQPPSTEAAISDHWSPPSGCRN